MKIKDFMDGAATQDEWANKLNELIEKEKGIIEKQKRLRQLKEESSERETIKEPEPMKVPT
jgi:hypothetical protein